MFRPSVLRRSHRRLTLTDDLTGLANRRALYEYAGSRLRSVRDCPPSALLLADLSRFKEVNDSLGRATGDEVLKQTARRLRAAARAQPGMVARLAGDEFALLVLGVDQSVAERVAMDVREAMASPVVLGDVSVLVTVNVGIALAPEHGADLSTLLRCADLAMDTAKQTQVGFSVYAESAAPFRGFEQRIAIENLRDDIAGRRIALHFQPKLDVATGGLVGVEALARWRHATLGLLAPAAFLPIVGDAGLMYEMTIAVLEQSLDQAAKWVNGGREIAVAVNLSSAALVDAGLPDRIGDMLRARGLPGRLLEVEVTEEVFMSDRERGRGVLQRLREMGISVAVDDFGSGYSSLATLRDLPIDELKLAPAFLRTVGHDGKTLAFMRATIELAHSLGLRMVAEGVEDEVTAAKVADSGCDRAQGFYYGHPLPPDEFELWLIRHERRRATAAALHARQRN